MLFDLRSRGRRRTVQGVYLGLALLMGGGLVLFGVGAGNGFGGLLNAFSNNGSSGAQKAVVSSQEKAAIAQTKAQPNNPAAWASLIQARFTDAGQSGYNTTTGTYTSAGLSELSNLASDWQRYLQLTKSPDPNLAILAARAYAQLGNYSGEASAWQIQTQANPNLPKAFLCYAAAAYAAKETRVGDLAAAKTLSLLPKSSRPTVKLELQQAKTSPTIAQTC